MPSPTDILAGLTTIANQAMAVAIGWHIVLAAIIIALLRGWRPSHLIGCALIALPLFSVGAFAFAAGNPFTAIVMVAAALALIVLPAYHEEDAPVTGAPAGLRLLGIAAIAFGWVYPHFLTGSPMAYLYAAPFGLVPCPTLAIAVGFALLGHASEHRAWNLVLAGVALFYAAFGIFRLGVTLDLGLAVPAVVLVATQVPHRRHSAIASSTVMASSSRSIAAAARTAASGARTSSSARA